MRINRFGAGVLAATALLGACTEGSQVTRPADDAMELPTPALAASPTNATEPGSGTNVPVTLDTTVVADEVVLRIDEAVRRGQPTTVSAATASNAMCSIVVTSPTGTRVDGLDAQGADGAGNVSWSWTVAADASPGVWPIDVDCTTVSGIRALARGVLRVE